MEIEEIRDILRFARTFSSKENGPLDLKNLYSEDSKLGEFYRILMDTKIQRDEEAANSIYGSAHPDTKYMFLKSNFTSRALNTVTVLELQGDDVPEETKVVGKAYKHLLIVSVLIRLGSRRAAISLAKKTLRLSEKYELHHVSVELLEYLRTHALLQGKTTEYEKYVTCLKQELSLLESESTVKTLEQRLLIHSAKSLYIDESLQEQARLSLEGMENELSKHDTFMIRMAHFKMQYMYYQLAGDPLHSILACNEAIEYMKGKLHLAPPSSFGEFELYKLENYILTRDYENGKEAALLCGNYFAPGMNRWFTYKGYQFILLMHTLKFSEAKTVFDEVTMHPRYQSQLAHLGERWEIFRVYLEYIADSEDEGSDGNKRKRTSLLRQNKYKKKVREFPTYSADKRGFNVSILMMNILLLLENDEKDLLLQQVEALSTYRFSHLKGKNSHQSAILFKLIRLMVRSDFDLQLMQKPSLILEKKLADTKPSPTEIFECVQVLPPSWIWGRMKAALEDFSG